MWLSAFFVLFGSIITFIAALGVLRLPDFFMRMHAATKAGVVGPSLLLVGAGLYEPSWGISIKIALAILFLLMTTPIAAHLLGKAGFVGGVSLWEGTARNDLDDVLPSNVFIETDAPIPSEKPAANMAKPPTTLPEQ
ncbi:monovalent cation/H(+) antiporter subunit G [Pusillimonas sp. T7-7]|uniref:monovalent cation/H(+) antiporter subunit G n=1 Tax=Pusillimonas sp. (strain T7-7) TaxID=1007105 RepID=UPI000674F9AA|nr:monovalent cation/H(+) antiporter subunit G [Pusillimonas sp. T7-7]